MREKSLWMFPYYITCGPPPQRERRKIFFREILIIIFIYLIEVWMKFLRTFFIISFCSLWSFCSFVVLEQLCTYLRVYGRVIHGEREERLREKSLWMFPHYIITITGPPQREEVLREILIIIIIIIIIFRRWGFFLYKFRH